MTVNVNHGSIARTDCYVQVRIERRNYHVHREKASARPDKYLSIIIDGMDQSKTALPKHLRVVGDDSASLKVHVMGALVHGQKIPAYAFTSLEDWPSDTNLNIQCLLHILNDIGWDELKNKVMFLQLDNTCRENKNYTMARFLALLVYLRVVNEVTRGLIVSNAFFVAVV